MILEVMDEGRDKRIYDCVHGVITNSPEYDWHLKNLHNYLKLTPSAPADRTFGGDGEDYLGKPYNVNAWGSGAVMIGIPGDYKPPTRFVRALMFAETVIKLQTADDAVTEAFRILSNFDIPMGFVHQACEEGKCELQRDEAIGDTQVTTCADVTNMRYYFHTMYNRRIQGVDLGSIRWDSFDDVVEFKMDPNKEQDMVMWSNAGIAPPNVGAEKNIASTRSLKDKNLKTIVPTKIESKFFSKQALTKSYNNNDLTSVLSYMIMGQAIIMVGTLAIAVLLYRRLRALPPASRYDHVEDE
jgi:hypothetical protein